MTCPLGGVSSLKENIRAGCVRRTPAPTTNAINVRSVLIEIDLFVIIITLIGMSPKANRRDAGALVIIQTHRNYDGRRPAWLVRMMRKTMGLD